MIFKDIVKGYWQPLQRTCNIDKDWLLTIIKLIKFHFIYPVKWNNFSNFKKSSCYYYSPVSIFYNNF